MESGITQGGEHRYDLGIVGFIKADDEGIGPWKQVRSITEQSAIPQDQFQDDVTHAEAAGRHGGSTVTFHEGVVAAAAGDGALGAAGLVDFPDAARVVGKAADNA